MRGHSFTSEPTVGARTIRTRRHGRGTGNFARLILWGATNPLRASRTTITIAQNGGEDGAITTLRRSSRRGTARAQDTICPDAAAHLCQYLDDVTVPRPNDGLSVQNGTIQSSPRHLAVPVLVRQSQTASEEIYTPRHQPKRLPASDRNCRELCRIRDHCWFCESHRTGAAG